MSREQESGSIVATLILVALLALVIFIVPVGFGYFYVVRQQIKQARWADAQARLQAEMVAARERAATARATVRTSVTPRVRNATLTVALDAEGRPFVDGEPVDLQNLRTLVASHAAQGAIIVTADPQCSSNTLGEIARLCLNSGATEVIFQSAAAAATVAVP